MVDAVVKLKVFMPNYIILICSLGIALFLGGCSPYSYILEPCISYIPQEPHIASLPSPFPPLTCKERKSDWGKELLIGNQFAKELDLYRAITAYKRSKILFSNETSYERTLQIEYDIFLAYYLGGRYQEAIDTFEGGYIAETSSDFPAIKELLIALFDCYMKTSHYEKGFRLLELIDTIDCDAGLRLRAGDSLLIADICGADGSASLLCEGSEVLDELSCKLCNETLSVRKAQVFNALLPGAGYYYVGQTKAAMTSFVINFLFTSAAYSFFKKGLWAPGLITTSLEMGWYLGGINGAGLAAKQYNECLYNKYAKEAMIKGKMFPILLFQSAF